MLIPFRQGLVQVQSPVFFNVTFPYCDLVVTDTNTIVAFAAGTKDYLYTEQETISRAWGPLEIGRDQWLYWDLNTRTGRRSFGITIHEPITSTTAPTNPVTDQHWFDLSTHNMYVWLGQTWSHRIRTFALKLSNGKVPISMSVNAPIYTGTQVGTNTNTYAGHILFDSSTTNAIRDSAGVFVTTEDQLSTKSISLSDVKLASIILEGEAQQNMAAHTIVVFSDFGKIVHADQFTAEQTRQFGMIETSVIVGQTVSVASHGMITSPDWDWSGVGVNALLYCDAAGAIITTPIIPNQAPIGTVLDTHTIILGSPTIQSNSVATSTLLATQLTMGISRLSVPAEDEEDPIVVGSNDPRLTDARPPTAHNHPISQVSNLQQTLDNKVSRSGDTMTGLLILSNDPVSNLGAATKQYVDANVVHPGGNESNIQYNSNNEFAASNHLSVSLPSQLNPTTTLIVGSPTDINDTGTLIATGNANAPISVAGGSININAGMLNGPINTGNIKFQTDGIIRLVIGKTGEWKLAGSAGLSGQVLTSAGPGATPTWTTSGGGSGVITWDEGNFNLFGPTMVPPGGGSNVAYGYNALLSLDSGYENVAIGVSALQVCGAGVNNTAVGYKALQMLTSGSNNVAIGNLAGQDAVANLTTQSNYVVLGNNSTTNANIKVAWTVTSDARDKTNIAPLTVGLDFINQLQPKQFCLMDRETQTATTGLRYGFLAQDVLAVEGSAPVIVDDSDLDNLKMRESLIVPALVKAVQELSAELALLKQQICDLTN